MSTGTMGRSARGKGHHALVKSEYKEKSGVGSVVTLNVRHEAKGQHWISFVYLGKRNYNLVLWANNALSHRKWLDSIVKCQQAIKEKSFTFETVPLSEGFFSGPNKVNCAAPFSECHVLWL
jgi:hypothetical protein